MKGTVLVLIAMMTLNAKADSLTPAQLFLS